MKLYKNEEFVDQGESIGAFYRTAEDHDEPIHRHDFIEIVYFLSGESEHTVDGVSYRVKRGDFLFINYGSTHSFSCRGAMEYVNISFSPETVGNTLITPENAFALLSLTAFNQMRGDSGGGMISFFGKEREEIERLIRAMVCECAEKGSYYGSVMQSYMNILIVKMLRKASLPVSADAEGIWRELSDYIDENIDSRLTLEALAKKCFYNPSYFSRIFKDKFGVSFKEYIGRKRIDYSCRLLVETENTVDEISALVGFSDRSSFYQLFAKYMGVTPSEYRKNNGGKRG